MFVVGANILAHGLDSEGRDTPGWLVDRITRVVASKNPPKRFRHDSMSRLSAVGLFVGRMSKVSSK